jgi:hypothetical protein
MILSGAFIRKLKIIANSTSNLFSQLYDPSTTQQEEDSKTGPFFDPLVFIIACYSEPTVIKMQRVD